MKICGCMTLYTTGKLASPSSAFQGTFIERNLHRSQLDHAPSPMVSSSQIETVELSKLGPWFHFIPCEICPILARVHSRHEVLLTRDVEALLPPGGILLLLQVASALWSLQDRNVLGSRRERYRVCWEAAAPPVGTPWLPPEKVLLLHCRLSLPPRSPSLPSAPASAMPSPSHHLSAAVRRLQASFLERRLRIHWRHPYPAVPEGSGACTS